MTRKITIKGYKLGKDGRQLVPDYTAGEHPAAEDAMSRTKAGRSF